MRGLCSSMRGASDHLKHLPSKEEMAGTLKTIRQHNMFSHFWSYFVCISAEVEIDVFWVDFLIHLLAL